MTILNTLNTSKSTVQQTVERQLAELIDEVRVAVEPQATLAAKVSFNPSDTLTKFNHLIEKAINNIKEERDQAIANQSSQAIIDNLNQQLEIVTERTATFQSYLSELVSSQPLARSMGSNSGNELSAWLDEISPLAEPEDLTEMPFQSLKADRTNIPRDFSAVNVSSPNIKARSLKNIDDFFLPEYIASANETEITDDILAKAKELDNSPVKIYEWVRNNVEWQPTWGGQQTADMTLDVCRGNAMDISTLMIALLRAANIPARYVHGTVDIPVDNFINMAGDFENIDAAMDFVSAGGIPVTSVTVGGKIAKVRIEHVWVEAAVPFYPSRGSKPVSERNPIDSWIPMDGSYKQYEYLKGIDGLANSTIDINKLANDFIGNGKSNQQEGWVENLNIGILDSIQPLLEKDLNNQIESMENPTVGDVVGGRKIIKHNFTMLPGSLPYISVVRGVSHTQLGSDLQVLVTLGLGYDRYIGEYQQQKTWPLYQLNQQNISINFNPATVSDEDTLKALVPKNIDDPSQLPNFFPSNIHVIPEIKLDNETLLISNTILALGEEIEVGYRFQMPTKVYFNKKDSVISGSYLALGIVGSNLSSKSFERLKSSLENTLNYAHKETPQELSQMPRERLIGDTFATTIYGYYANYVSQTKVMSLESKVNHHIVPTAGTFGYEPYQRRLFGINRGIEAHAFYMNARVAQIVQHRSGDKDQNIAFYLRIGMLSSALEHAIPEQMFLDPQELDQSKKPNTISAVKAILMGIEQGQKIYLINQANKAISLQYIYHDASTMTEIQQALATGKTVITHTNSIQTQGWKGAGYIIFDPETGEGAYKIGGGKNGSVGQLFGFAGAIIGTIALKIGVTSPAGIVLLFYTFHLMFINVVIALCTGEINLEAGMSTATLVLAILRVNTSLVQVLTGKLKGEGAVIAVMAAVAAAWAAYGYYNKYLN